jgi:delta14-sterol reductase
MTTSARTKGELNPRSTSYEFGGPLGSAVIILIVPILVYSLYFGCSGQYGCPSPLVSVKEFDASTLVNPNFWKSLWDTEAVLVYLAWYTFCIVSWAVLPGDWVEGLPMRNSQRMKYKINGRYPPISRNRRNS